MAGVPPVSGAPRASVIVVSYNTRALTLKCLERLFAESAGLDFEVVVVDNASSDASAAAIRDAHPDVHLIESAENLGFACAVNLAAQAARGEFLLLLNPDAQLLDRALEKLLAFADAHPDAGLVGGVACHPDGAPNQSSCWNRPTLWSSFCQGIGLSALFRDSRLFNSEVVRLRFPVTAQRVDIVSGCLLLIRRSLWEKLGGFDPAFFMYGEDFDLSLRADAFGAARMIAPDARVVHVGGASESDNADRLVRLLRSKAQLFDRHFSPFGAWAAKRTLSLWALTRWIGYGAASFLGRQTQASAAAWRSVWRRRAEFLVVPAPIAMPGAPRR